jgi:hypothetical protein
MCIPLTSGVEFDKDCALVLVVGIRSSCADEGQTTLKDNPPRMMGSKGKIDMVKIPVCIRQIDMDQNPDVCIWKMYVKIWSNIIKHHKHKSSTHGQKSSKHMVNHNQR